MVQQENEAGEIDLGQVAADIHGIADQIEAGRFVALAVATCDEAGEGMQACCVDRYRATPELLDEMVYVMKAQLFEQLSDE